MKPWDYICFQTSTYTLLFFSPLSDNPHNSCFTYAVFPSIFMLLAFIIQGHNCCCYLYILLLCLARGLCDVCSGYVCWKAENWKMSATNNEVVTWSHCVSVPCIALLYFDCYALWFIVSFFFFFYFKCLCMCVCVYNFLCQNANKSKFFSFMTFLTI